MLDIVKFPGKNLKRVSEPVKEITDEIRVLSREMVETMYEARGIGLAAPQVGHPFRLITVDTEWTSGKEKNPFILINPEILSKEGNMIITEGCLSIPDFDATLNRAKKVTLRATNLATGKVVKYKAEGLLAACFQHEVDHLDGVLISDRALDQ